MSSVASVPKASLFGHPAGLYTLFFAEMWERFSYYGMRALLIFYMIKGFLGYGDGDAYTVYGAYTALVYMTPFFGGMLADRLLGARRSVIFGAMLMAAGEAMLMVPQLPAILPASFVPRGHLLALAAGRLLHGPRLVDRRQRLLQAEHLDDRRFAVSPSIRESATAASRSSTWASTLARAMSPLLCGYIGETYGWSWGFGLATVGMLIGLAVFVLPRLVTARRSSSPARLPPPAGLVCSIPSKSSRRGQRLRRPCRLSAAAIVAAVAISRGGLPHDAGLPADPERLQRRIAGVLPGEWAVYLGAIVLVPVFVLLVSGGAHVDAPTDVPWSSSRIRPSAAGGEQQPGWTTSPPCASRK